MPSRGCGRARQRRLLSLCFAWLKNYTAAEEVTQEAFIRAFKYLDTFDSRRPFYPWLAKITVRLVQQHKIQQQTPELPLQVNPHDADSAVHPLTTLIRDERAHALWAAVLQLPLRERAAVILFYRHELTVQQTATSLGVTTGTVKTMLFRARKHLRRSLAFDQRRKT